MVIVRLFGGLGNQMFQYALGRHLAYLNNTALLLDIASFQDNQFSVKRTYQLDIFNISAQVLPFYKSPKFSLKSKIRLINFNRRIMYKLHKHYDRFYIFESGYSFQEKMLSLRQKKIYLDGYWQSEKYFRGIKDIIKKEFTFINEQSEVNKHLEKKIKNVESVSIHIRRGDYLTNPEINKYHGLCPLSYYQKAMDIMKEELNNPHFFVFSDDGEWVQNNLKSSLPIEYITHNQGQNSFDDMRLMSSCSHHIIANSSFSWWAAWLADNPSKVVITPLKWFNNSPHDTKDLIPEGWQRI